MVPEEPGDGAEVDELDDVVVAALLGSLVLDCATVAAGELKIVIKSVTVCVAVPEVITTVAVTTSAAAEDEAAG